VKRGYGLSGRNCLVGFASFYDLSASIIAALGACVVTHLRVAAVRAFHQRWLAEAPVVVRAPASGAGF
jgi:hypothetical protein